ncbi:MAG TPA: glycosyltransferase [Bacilli bacterium]|nr:glycosyltransferase [Bacilli bacterium]
MKILIVFNHPAPYKVALFNGLSKSHDVHVIFERSKEKDRHDDFYNEKKYNFKVHFIKGINIGTFNHFSFGVKRHLKKHQYDLIIMNGYSTFTEMIALNYLKRKKINYAFYINGGIAKNETKLKTKIKRHFLQGAFLYFSPAQEASDYLVHYGVDQKLIHHYPYSTVYEKDIVTRKLSQQTKKAFWQNENITGENFTVCVTSFIKRKNNLCLINAWEDIDEKHPLVLIGDGKRKRLYEKTIKKLKLRHVHLLPFMSRDLLFNYLKHADNAVYLSNFDIYGHVINEALAHGLNVLTNNNMVAARHLIRDTKNGLILNDGDDLTEKLEVLFKSNFWNEATKTAKSNTIEKSLERHLKIIGTIK